MGGPTVDAVGMRNVYISMQLKEHEPTVSMIYVMYVPKHACDLVSVRAAASKKKSVKFSNGKCWSGTGSLVDKLYQLDCEVVSSEHASVVSEQGCDLEAPGIKKLERTISRRLSASSWCKE